MPSAVGPQRIVCLTEEPTEILWALGEGVRVVGISAWTVRPPEAREAAPIVSAFIDGSVEKIAALDPDLVIGFSDIQADLAAKLIRAGLQVLIFNQRTVEEILGVIATLGHLVGRGVEAEALVASYRARIEAMRAETATNASRPRVYFEEWPDPMITGIRWVSEIIEIAGGDDVFAAKSRGAMAKERFVTSDDVVTARPDLILASWCGKPVEHDTFGARPGWDDLSAARADRIVEIPSATILQPGPGCLTTGLDEVRAAIDAWREG